LRQISEINYAKVRLDTTSRTPMMSDNHHSDDAAVPVSLLLELA